MPAPDNETAMAEILKFPRIVNTVPQATNSHLEMVQVIHDGTVALADRDRQTDNGDWTNQELAELYRVESILLQANVKVSTARGVTDENDPWFVFCRENGDVFLHLARIDGAYLLDGYGIDSIISGLSFKSLINQFVERSEVRSRADNVVQLKSSVLGSDVIRLHPTVMLAALVWTLYLSSDEWMGVAHAADGIASQSNNVGFQHFYTITPPQAANTEPVGENNSALTFKLSAEATYTPKVEGRDHLQNFYAFLAIHGVGLGIPVVVSQITSPTVTVPEISEFDSRSFQKNASVSFFDIDSTQLNRSLITNNMSNTHSVDFTRSAYENSPNNTNYHNYLKHYATNDFKISDIGNIDFMIFEQDAFKFKNVYMDIHSIVSVIKENNENFDQKTIEVYNEILHRFDNINHFKISGVDFSTTLDYQELQKILPQIKDAIVPVGAQGIGAVDIVQKSGNFLGSPAGEHSSDNSSSVEIAIPAGSAAGRDADAAISQNGPVIVVGSISHYNAAANSFVNELINKPNIIEMVKIGPDVVLVDMSALDEQTDVPYMRTWVTDAGFRISTIGHVSDFQVHGLI